jgi:hypothetical protein
MSKTVAFKNVSEKTVVPTKSSTLSFKNVSGEIHVPGSLFGISSELKAGNLKFDSSNASARLILADFTGTLTFIVSDTNFIDPPGFMSVDTSKKTSTKAKKISFDIPPAEEEEKKEDRYGDVKKKTKKASRKATPYKPRPSGSNKGSFNFSLSDKGDAIQEDCFYDDTDADTEGDIQVPLSGDTPIKGRVIENSFLAGADDDERVMSIFDPLNMVEEEAEK